MVGVCHDCIKAFLAGRDQWGAKLASAPSGLMAVERLRFGYVPAVSLSRLMHVPVMSLHAMVFLLRCWHGSVRVHLMVSACQSNSLLHGDAIHHTCRDLHAALGAA